MTVPQGWKVKKLKDCVFIDKESLGNKTSPDYSFQYISLSDVDCGKVLQYQKMKFVSAPSRARRKVRAGDVLLGTVRPNLQPFAYIKNGDNIIASTGFAVLTPKNRHSASYIFQYLFSEHANNQFYNFVVGSNYPALNSCDVKAFKILLPPLPEQKKIAKILSCWDEAIEETERLITAKKTFKKGIMQKLLSGKVRFKGFNGKAGYSRLKGLVKEVSRRKKDSKVDTVLSVTNSEGFVAQNKYFGKKIASEDISNYKVVKKGQFGFSPPRINVGSIALLEGIESGVISPIYVVFETIEDKLLPEYMKQFIRSSWFNGHVRCLTQGSVRDSLSFDALEQIRIFAPSIDEQKRISDTLSAIDKEIDLLEKKRDLLKKQKKGLMQKLLTGKIRLKHDRGGNKDDY